MNDLQPPAPNPAPAPQPPPEWVGKLYWRLAKFNGGLGKVAGPVLAFVCKWSGPVALALVLLGTPSGCHLPHIPWPPIPWPTPTPPVPPAPPSPIPGDGLRVLIVYDASKVLPAAQQAVIDGADVRAYLNAHCATDGKQKEFRILPATTDVSNESATWQAVMKRPRTSLPWVVIGNGKSGFEGPLPGTVADTLALLQKFGGN